MTVTNAVETTMIWGTVSGASMVGMVISLLLSVGLPIFLGIFIVRLFSSEDNWVCKNNQWVSIISY